jgi:hypothetical protein
VSSLQYPISLSLHLIASFQSFTMAKSMREILGVSPSTATTSDSVLLIIDAQNE